MSLAEFRLHCRNVNVGIKIVVGAIGLLAAWFWYLSATSPTPGIAADRNAVAALMTGVAAALQGASACIDAWVPPTASWR